MSPRHVAIIMDGNGRWAKQKGLPSAVGHKQGVEALIRTAKACGELGVKHLSVYAFSTENWGRPKEEVDAIFKIFSDTIDKQIDKLKDNKISVKFFGRIDGLPGTLKNKILFAEKETDGGEFFLNVMVNYGGRAEIVDAAKRLTEEAAAGRTKAGDIDEALFSGRLYTAGMPDPDLIIRTAGEMRLSNFLIWQSAYAELWFTDTLWPDFGEADLKKAFADFDKRERRYGKRK